MNRLVIDVGCATYGGDSSIPALVEEFEPMYLYGFDPSTKERTYRVDGTQVREYSMAAWTHDGHVGFSIANLGGKVDPHGVTTECVDLAAFINRCSEGTEIILKMDAEGAEYDLIPHLRENDADLRLKSALIEWHCEGCGYGIWDFNAPHPGEGCTFNPDAWRQRQADMADMLRCEVGGWNK